MSRFCGKLIDRDGVAGGRTRARARFTVNSLTCGWCYKSLAPFDSTIYQFQRAVAQRDRVRTLLQLAPQQCKYVQRLPFISPELFHPTTPKVAELNIMGIS